MDLFYIDISKKQKISWDLLLQEINNSFEYNPYCYHNDFYSVFKHIIISLLLGETIILLDSDFSEDEICNLIGKDVISRLDNTFRIDIKKKPSIKSKIDLIEKIKNSDSSWAITLFTSGTTGIPKKVVHSFQSISRFVKITDKNKGNIWGFSYNPTHIAGIQVFLQALLNGNPIIRLFGLPKKNVFESISLFEITHISATPTFYRLLFPATGIYKSIRTITSGGEKFDSRTSEKLKQIFPNASFINIYASTEAGTLFAAKGNGFTIKPEMKPFVKFLENELLVHKSIMGQSESSTSDWYHTGDIVRITSGNPLTFQFESRKNEMINVGGYKVNPSEVEEIIRGINGIQDARVFAKKNSVMGNIICCEVVKTIDDINEIFIRLYLQSKLQEFKIPRIITFTNSISTTHTGKIKRN